MNYRLPLPIGNPSMFCGWSRRKPRLYAGWWIADGQSAIGNAQSAIQGACLLPARP